MSFIPTPNAVRVSVEAAANGRSIINTLWFTKASPYSSSDIEDLLATLDYDWATYVLPYTRPEYVVSGYVGYAQDYDSAPVGLMTPAGAFQGTDTAGFALTLNTAAAVTLYTANRGRSSRGRIFFGAIGGNRLLDSTHFTTAYRDALESVVSHIRADAAAQGHSFVVVSHFHNKAARAEGLAQPVTSWVCNGRVDSQRHRLGKS